MMTSSVVSKSQIVPVLAVLLLGSLSLSVAAVTEPTSEASEAQISDPTQECKYYNYPPVQQAAASFPKIWTTASILPGDTAAQDKWNSISSGAPSIPPKTSSSGSTYPSSDPDCWWTDAQCTTPKLSGLPPDVASVPEPLTMGYGFDDGPNCSHNAFYDYLQQQNQKATFFYIGSNVMDWPLQAQRALADGHEICAHTWSHPSMTTLSSENAFAELWYTMQAIKLVVGVTPTCWRPPLGDVDDRIRYIAHALGLQTIMWQYDTFDWEEGTGGVTAAAVDTNYQNFIHNATSGAFNTHGSILLTHELDNFTMSEAVKFHPQLQQAFKYMVPVGVALNKTQPYVETNYSLPSFEQYISGTLIANASTSPSSAASTSNSNSPSPTGSGSASGKPNGGVVSLGPSSLPVFATAITAFAVMIGVGVA